jgi:hypothetical protein
MYRRHRPIPVTLLVGADGVTVDLAPVCWEFPPDAGDGDDRWLVIAGHVDLGDRGWSFTDPCLLMDEARALTGWLRAAGERRIGPDTRHPDPVRPDPVDDGGEPDPSLSFLEPVLGFSLFDHSENKVTVGIHFMAEIAPPWLREDDPFTSSEIVRLQVHPEALKAAANDWVRELDALPGRPWVEQR